MEKTSSRLRFIGFDPPPLAIERGSRRSPREGAAAQLSSCSQLLLFTDRVVLAELLRRAVISADYEEAARIARRLASGWGEDAVPPELRFVHRLRHGFWEHADQTAATLEAWSFIEGFVPPGTTLWRRMRNGFFGRLLSLHPAEALAADHPQTLRPVVDTLLDIDAVADARRLVRDALLAGSRIDSEGLEDPSMVRLLSEDLDPRWLASLGAIRRLWPLPRPTPLETAAIARRLQEPISSDEDARAVDFWHALRLAELRGAIDEPLLHAARKRLKRLNEDLHAIYMHGAGPVP